jgi:hypothetical protein
MGLSRNGGRQAETPKLLCLSYRFGDRASLPSVYTARLFVAMDRGNTLSRLRHNDGTHGALQIRFSRSDSGKCCGSAYRVAFGLSDYGSSASDLFIVTLFRELD